MSIIIRLPIFIQSPSSSRFHHNQLTLSSNATSNINPQFETFSQPFIVSLKTNNNKEK